MLVANAIACTDEPDAAATAGGGAGAGNGLAAAGRRRCPVGDPADRHSLGSASHPPVRTGTGVATVELLDRRCRRGSRLFRRRLPSEAVARVAPAGAPAPPGGTGSPLHHRA